MTNMEVIEEVNVIKSDEVATFQQPTTPEPEPEPEYYTRSNYSLNNSYVTSINVDPDERTIYLSTNGLKENSSYWLSIVELEDKFGNKSEKIINIEKVQPVTVPFKVTLIFEP